MFGLFKERKSDDQVLEEEFNGVLSAFDKAPEVNKLAIAYMLAFCWKLFNSKFGSQDEFKRSSRDQQFDYLRSLTSLESKLVKDGKKLEAVGVALMKMYLAPLMEGDDDMALRMAKKLEPLNQLGWPLL